jgi:hypothetical protein
MLEVEVALPIVELMELEVPVVVVPAAVSPRVMELQIPVAAVEEVIMLVGMFTVEMVDPE